MTTKIQAARQSAQARTGRDLARRALWRLAPAYARRRSSRISTAQAVERLETDLRQLRKRHTEQIERLEDLVRELVSTAEALRRELALSNRHDEA